MKLKTFFYTLSSGWSIDSFPALDSERTWVIVFGGPDFVETPAPVQALAQAYPRSHIVGCSSSGEIFETAISDNHLVVGVIQFEHTQLASTTVPVPAVENSYTAGQALAQRLYQPSLRGVFILS